MSISTYTLQREATALIKEMAQILADQIGHECPACGAKDEFAGGRTKLLTHTNDCAIVRARAFLGQDESIPEPRCEAYRHESCRPEKLYHEVTLSTDGGTHVHKCRLVCINAHSVKSIWYSQGCTTGKHPGFEPEAGDKVYAY